MKNSEKGFTYPLTLCLLILFLLFFSMNIERLLSERKLVHETATIEKQEYYFLSSVKKIEKIFEMEGSIPATGSIHYLDGDMDFRTDTPAGNNQKISFTLRLHSGITILGSGIIDTKSKKLIKWNDIQ